MSTFHDRVDATSAEKVCCDCVEEPYLSDCIRSNGQLNTCSFCNNHDRNCVDIYFLADQIEGAFQRHFTLTSDEPDALDRARLSDREENYEWVREGEQTVHAIMDAAQVSEIVAKRVQELLEDKHRGHANEPCEYEVEFSEGAHYEEVAPVAPVAPDDSRWRIGWSQFEKRIKTKARFFDRKNFEQMQEIFDAVDRMITFEGLPIVESAGPFNSITHLFRARVFQKECQLFEAMKRPDLELSAPPADKATSGRMNAQGISVFYGALAAETALAEVRPPVGSWVAIARFKILRPLRLLDISRLRRVFEDGSIFDPDYVHRLGRASFLRTFCDRISQPVMPDHQEMEYLPTQALADYMSNDFEPSLDGLLFPSSQVSSRGLNAVLFNKASRSEALDIPLGTEINASTFWISEDNPEPYFSIEERVPRLTDESSQLKHNAINNQHKSAVSREIFVADADERAFSLKVDVESLTVCRVQAINYERKEFPIKHTRSEV